MRFLPARPIGEVRNGTIVVVSEPVSISEKYLEGMDWNLNRKLGKAFTYWSFIAKTNFDFGGSVKRIKPETFELTITGVRIVLSLPITMWLPYGVAGSLHEHENGHRRICERLYSRAPGFAVECAKPLIGQTLEVSAKNRMEAERVANLQLHVRFATCYAEHTQKAADKINDIFDEVTNHGLNKVPVTEGIETSFKRFKEKELEIHPNDN